MHSPMYTQSEGITPLWVGKACKSLFKQLATNSEPRAFNSQSCLGEKRQSYYMAGPQLGRRSRGTAWYRHFKCTHSPLLLATVIILQSYSATMKAQNLAPLILPRWPYSILCSVTITSLRLLYITQCLLFTAKIVPDNLC